MAQVDGQGSVTFPDQVRPTGFRERKALNRRCMTQMRKLQRLSAPEHRSILSDLVRFFPEDFRVASRVCES